MKTAQNTAKLTPVNLRQLRYFIAVAEELHFGRAAKRLKMAQPPLSQQIRGLEKHLGVELFERTSRRVELTRHGRLFLEEARVLLRQAQRMEELMNAASRGYVGKIGIGFVHSVLYSILSPALREFHTQQPLVELNCVGLPPARQLEALRQREIDVGFHRSEVMDDGLKAYPLLREPVFLAVPEDHRLARAEAVRLEELAQEEVVVYSRRQAPGIYDQMMTAFRDVGVTPHFSHEGRDMPTVLAIVAAGLGVALVSSSVRRLGYPGVVFVALASPLWVDLALVVRSDETEPMIDAFREACRKVAARPMLDCWNKPYWIPLDSPG